HVTIKANIAEGSLRNELIQSAGTLRDGTLRLAIHLYIPSNSRNILLSLLSIWLYISNYMVLLLIYNHNMVTIADPKRTGIAMLGWLT
ncbi:MAG: hypothetical protein WBE34_10895, partial [Candidatus Nitrosopolaris sp.]